MKKYALLLTTCLAFASAYGQSPSCDQCVLDPLKDHCPELDGPDYPGEQFASLTTAEGGPQPLFWDIYLPNEAQLPAPVVILVKDAGFEKGRRCDGELKCIARELTASGFAVVSIDIRHDQIQADKIPCQVNAAYAPPAAYRQVTDLKKAIRWARYPATTSILFGKVNHKVGAVGGSGGGAHVAWCAATGVIGNGNNEKLDAAVCLSGAYKFDDQSSLEDMGGQNGMGFCANVTTYCQGTNTWFRHGVRAATAGK